MSIEQRVAGAIADLREALGDGACLEDAIAKVAADYELKPEVLRIRAEKQFGNLSALHELVALQRANVSAEASARSIYVNLRASWGFKTEDGPVLEAFVKSLEKDFDFSPKEKSGTLSAQQERAVFFRDLATEFNRVIDDARNP